MGILTGISWADHTRNIWMGCSKMSPACDFCYAERESKRFGLGWGSDAERRLLNPEHWLRDFRKWNKQAKNLGKRRTVFVNSFSDFCEDRPEYEPIRARFWEAVPEFENLIFLILTKRAANLARMLPWGATDEPWANVYGGVTVENQKWANIRVQHLLRANLSRRFVSYEPALGPVNLNTAASLVFGAQLDSMSIYPMSKLDWVIAGGESGSKARPMHPDWMRAIRDACIAAGVPFHFKQWGEWIPDSQLVGSLTGRERWGVIGHGGEFVESTGRKRIYNPLCECAVLKVGKPAAGHLLDGVAHLEFPTPAPMERAA